MGLHLLNKPRLHPSYYVITVPDSNEIQLQCEGRTVRLSPSSSPDSPRLLNKLIVALDGTHTISEIVQNLGEFDESQIVDALHRLYDARLLDDVAPLGTALSADQRESYASQINFFSHFTNGAYAVQETLTRSSVTVLGLGPLGLHTLGSLADNGVGKLIGIAFATESCAEVHDLTVHQPTTRCPKSGYRRVTLADRDASSIAAAVRGTDILIVTLDHHDPQLLDKANEACLHTGTRWLPVGLRASEGYVGPTVIPRQTACYKCYDLRMKANLVNYEPYRLYEEHLCAVEHRLAFGSLPQFARIVADLAATEVLKVLTHFSPVTSYGRMFTLNFLTLAGEFQEILKLPRCPMCGEPSQHRPMMKPWSE